MLDRKSNTNLITGAMVESLERRDLFWACGEAPLPTQEVTTSEPAVQVQDGTSNTLMLGESYRPAQTADAADYVVWRKTDGTR